MGYGETSNTGSDVTQRREKWKNKKCSIKKKPSLDIKQHVTLTVEKKTMYG